MKSVARYTILAAVLAVAPAATMQAATTPSPTPEATKANTYPSVLPLTLEVSGDKAAELKTLRELTITAQREDQEAPVIVIGPVDPFTSENTCKRPMPEGLSGCVVNADADTATLRIKWTVPQAGVYRFVLSGKRGTNDRVVTIGSFDLEARD